MERGGSPSAHQTPTGLFPLGNELVVIFDGDKFDSREMLLHEFLDCIDAIVRVCLVVEPPERQPFEAWIVRARA